MLQFILFEIKRWVKTPMVWVFFLITFLMAFGAVASDNVNLGGGEGTVFKNSPMVVQNHYFIFSLLCLLMTTSFMNATAMRDYESGMYQFIFTSPIKKFNYFFGKFFGAAIISIIPILGITLGIVIAPDISMSNDWVTADRFMPTHWGAHAAGLFSIAIPNIIISGAFVYLLALKYRSSIISYLGAVFLLFLNILSGNFVESFQTEWLGSIIDPFGGNTFDLLTRYLTIEEKNSITFGSHPMMLTNRVVWLVITLVGMFIFYRKFSFTTTDKKNIKSEDKHSEKSPVLTQKVFQPTEAGKFSWVGLVHQAWLETKAIIKTPSFIILLFLAVSMVLIPLYSLQSNLGVKNYPFSYNLFKMSLDNSSFYIIAFIVFYTGMLVWREKDAKINEIQDATPALSIQNYFSKLAGLSVGIMLMLLAIILANVFYQTTRSFYIYDWAHYFSVAYLIQFPKYFFIIVLGLLIQYLFNNRYIGYFVLVVFYILNGMLWSSVGIQTNMMMYGFLPTFVFSGMNGFGPYVESMFWFIMYWLSFSMILIFITLSLIKRGNEMSFKPRWKSFVSQLKIYRIPLMLSLIVFAGMASWVYYNTKVLNSYSSEEEDKKIQIEYEKKYKKFENLPMPKITHVDYQIDIFPKERNLMIKSGIWVKNIHSTPLQEIHFTLLDPKRMSVEIAGLQPKLWDKKVGYAIFTLKQPLAPQDSILVNAKFNYITKGFENEVTNTTITENGTFFYHQYFLPIIGYDESFEISGKKERKKEHLTEKVDTPVLDMHDTNNINRTYFNKDADLTTAKTVISTSKDQIAVAPGKLVRQWEKGNRRYYEYQLNQKSNLFHCFTSARFEVARRKWKGVNLEVYYDKKHEYNVNTMLNAMENALKYYSEQFGPYPYQDCRIVEFPKYRNNAQSFPTTMPYSESIGFVNDLRDIHKTDGVDLVSYVVSHEIAHQWWGHQVTSANMEGAAWISEGLSQYSALMLMEKQYGRNKMNTFLKKELDGYLASRGKDYDGEKPLLKVGNQNYIYYNKSSLVMVYLKEMIGEKAINTALRNLVTKFGRKGAPFTTSQDLLNELKKVTPQDKQYLLTDWIENRTIFSNQMVQVTKKKVGHQWQVNLTTKTEKFRSDEKGKETAMEVNDYIDIGVFAKNPKDSDKLGKSLYTQRIKVTKKDNQFTFMLKEEPYEAGIDPYHYLIDRISEDNIKKF